MSVRQKAVEIPYPCLFYSARKALLSVLDVTEYRAFGVARLHISM